MYPSLGLAKEINERSVVLLADVDYPSSLYLYYLYALSVWTNLGKRL